MPPANYFEFGVDKIGSTMSTHALALDAVIKSDLHNIMLQSGSGASAVYIKTDNKVGIANSAPSEALDVTGYAHASSGYKTGSYGMVIDTSGNFTGVKGTLTGNLIVDNDTLFVDSSNNNIGIGTTSPESGYKLHIVGNTRIEGNITVNGTTTVVNTNVQDTERLEVINDGTGPAARIIQKGAQIILEVLDGSNNCFVIEDGGHVLIGGAADSTYQLDVSGNAHFINNVDISGNTDISGNLNVGGNADISGSLTCSSMNIDGNFGVAGDFDLSGNFRILTDKFVVDPAGNVSAAGNLDISGNFNVAGDKFNVNATNGDTDILGILDVSGNFNVAGDKFNVNATNGDTDILGILDVSGNFNVAGNKFNVDATNGNTDILGILDVSGNFNVATDKFTVDATNGNTTIDGTLHIDNNFFIDNDGINVFNIDAATGTTEIIGELYVDGNFYIADDKFTVDATTGETNVAGHFNVASDRFTVNFESGDTSVAGILDVTGDFNVAADKFTVNSESGDTVVGGTLTLAGNFAVDTDVLFVDVTNNKVGINGITPGYELDVSGSIATNYAIMFNSGTDGAFGHRDNNNATSFALLQTSGGQTTINCKAGAGNIEFKHGSSVAQQQFDSSGNVIIQGNLFSYSDARIKTNVVTIPNALDKVLSLRGVTYNMIKDVEIDPENAIRHIGVIAQEVEAVLPEAVKEENGIKTVAYGNIVGLLIEAIKDLKDQMNK